MRCDTMLLGILVLKTCVLVSVEDVEVGVKKSTYCILHTIIQLYAIKLKEINSKYRPL